MVKKWLNKPHGLFIGIGELLQGGVFEGLAKGPGERFPNLMEGEGRFAFSGFSFLDELGVNGLDNVGEGDFGGFSSQEVASAFATLGDDEISLFEVREDLH